ncbi:hypothetical protein DXG01_011428 [Tephrocybe rancida]|nr:hypothetical protein DXG01_011428 [Tephrocybe rancida]
MSRGVRFDGTFTVVGSPSDSTNDAYTIEANRGEHRTFPQGTFTPREAPHAEGYSDGIHNLLIVPSLAIDLGGGLEILEPISEEELEANATTFHVSSFVVTSESLPVGVIIDGSPGREISVRDVLSGVIGQLQQPVPEAFLQKLERLNRSRLEQVKHLRDRRVVDGKLSDNSVRWIDWLSPDERTFMGLSSEQSLEAGVTSRVLKIPGRDV